MRQLRLSIILLSICFPVVARSQQADEELLAKTRVLYDAPFTRGLCVLDCAVQFDWKKHFVETVGQVPPRPFRLWASSGYRAPGLCRSLGRRDFRNSKGYRPRERTSCPELERALQAIVSSGLNAWLPFGTNVILFETD